MPATLNLAHRLEPDAAQRVLDKGLAAELADPLWFLARQWQLGEHRGEDASSPVRVEVRYAEVPIELPTGSADASTQPTEAIVESEPGQWWTPGRRVAIGRRVASRAEASGLALDLDSFVLTRLPPPYQHLNGRGVDGLALYKQRAVLGVPDDWFGAPVDAPTHWDPARLNYNTTLRAGGAPLHVREHAGGDLRWFAADGEGAITTPARLTQSVLPDRLRYPGAPLPRWWALEDPAHDAGGFAPDRTHFATLLMIELVTLHADDWFGFPITMNAGHVLVMESATVVDSFGDRYALSAPSDDWSLYATRGLSPTSLVTFAGGTRALGGPPLERVDVFVDEDANLAWAVERILDGHEIRSTGTGAREGPGGEVDLDRPVSYSYEPSRPPPSGWHPYPLEVRGAARRFIQGRLADYSVEPPSLREPPAGELLSDPHHALDPSAIASRGVSVERRYRLARDHRGTPVLWLQRQRRPRTEWASSNIDFDIARPDPQSD